MKIDNFSSSVLLKTKKSANIKFFWMWKMGIRAINSNCCAQSLTRFLLRPPQPPTIHNFFLSQKKDLTKTRHFYSSAMALILPQLKDIANFVLKLICFLCTISLSLSVCLTHIWFSYVFGIIRTRPIDLPI